MMRTADGFDFLHPFFYGRLREVRAFFKFLQNAGSFVLLLETLQCAINGFIVVNIDTDQMSIHLLIRCLKGRGLIFL
jgi:hypothetical protein